MGSHSKYLIEEL